MPEAILEVEDSVAGYGRMEILHGVSLVAREGQITAIIGPNGAGKSTLLKILAGELKPTSGHIRFRGQEVTGLAPHTLLHKGIVYMPQGPRVFPKLTVRENLLMGGYSLPSGEAVEGGLEQVYGLFPKLREHQGRMAGALSGGQRAMVNFGMAMMCRPEIILLDEPSAGLAPKILVTVFRHIKDLNTSGITFLIVEQNIRKVMEIAHHVYILDKGKAAFAGPPTQLRSRQELMRLYLGLERQNSNHSATTGQIP